MGRPAEGGVSVGDSMMAGAFAGMLSRVAVAPLDVIKIRMQVQVEPVGPRRGALGAGKYRGIAQCARTILKEEGARTARCAPRAPPCTRAVRAPRR